MNTKRLHTFRKEIHSDFEDKDYEGQFTCRKASVMDQSKIARRKAELSGGMFCVRDDDGNPTGQGLDEEAEMLNYAIATLEVLLVQKPDWYNLEEIVDGAMIWSVYKEVMEFQNIFRGRRGDTTQAPEAARSSQGTSTSERKETDGGHNSPKVVDGKVPIALDA